MLEQLEMPEPPMNSSAYGTTVSNDEVLAQDITTVSKKGGKQSTLRDYEVSIRFLSIGMVIRVGCREIPFTSVEEGMAELNAYVADPHTEIRKWMKKFD